ncbi:amidohydrolase family protein [Microbacterium yannicii]|uniref:Amidohydrolase family protein n=1 Tax=Microbacterium yannicii TaxID=671622 RepID=A0ABP9M652_9MICO|nr:amidohydrolase family protein [Microbacterium yannicii]MCO5954802.1 amidohydrolase family protein [Microbacterium yannicii]
MTGIIDAHTHIWDRRTGDYTWLTAEYGPIHRDFALEDFAHEREQLGVDAVVLVQAADTAGDTDRMLAAAERHREVAGVVAWLPLADPGLPRVLEQRLATRRVVGVRALVHEMADREWLLRSDVAAGLDAVAAAELPFDLVTSGPEALSLVPRLVERHPTLRIVIDHLGKPPVGGDAEFFARWRALLRDAAASPRVAAKLSGLASAVGPPDAWTVAGLRPVVDEAVEAFGAERLMYGGDWPVSTLAGGCTRVFEGLHEALDVSADELAHIHRGTATRWYRLGERAKDETRTP